MSYDFEAKVIYQYVLQEYAGGIWQSLCQFNERETYSLLSIQDWQLPTRLLLVLPEGAVENPVQERSVQ
ncbi:MAG: hypothetical protein H7Y31_08425 [Chitinophagaceae bacterium]|nr:hypothetical protein [Chitinophagaceae bacterium]